MGTSDKKPPAAGDDDFSELDAFGPMDDSATDTIGLRTSIASIANVSGKSAIELDQDRARALRISHATTTIEPLPADRTAFVVMPGGKPVPLVKSVTVMGRAVGVADIVVDGDGVSRQHAAIVYAHGEFFIEDLESSNGTRIDGRKIDVAKLSPGMSFALGMPVLRFMLRPR